MMGKERMPARVVKKGRLEPEALGHLMIALPESYIEDLNREAFKIRDHLRSRVIWEFFEWGWKRFCEERNCRG